MSRRTTRIQRTAPSFVRSCQSNLLWLRWQSIANCGAVADSAVLRLCDYGDKVNQILYDRLCELARTGGVTRYGEIAPIVGLDMANHDHRNQMSVLLEEISRDEHLHGRPLLSAVVIHAEDNMPGNGFFVLATNLNLFQGGDRFLYFIEELRRVHDQWNSNVR